MNVAELLDEIEDRITAVELKMAHIRSNPALGNDCDEMDECRAEHSNLRVTQNIVARCWVNHRFKEQAS